MLLIYSGIYLRFSFLFLEHFYGYDTWQFQKLKNRKCNELLANTIVKYVYT